jgi:uncharacterized protein (DUF488 family)
MDETPTRIYTIGHSNVPASRIVELLQGHGVEMVVDVRSAPYSRWNPQFNRKALEETLREAGIGYAFAGEYLGGRPQDPSCYRGGTIPKEKADYPKLIDPQAVMSKSFFQVGIRRLLEYASQRRTAILCSEKDPEHCHRTWLIGRYLEEELGVEVVHIELAVDSG